MHEDGIYAGAMNLRRQIGLLASPGESSGLVAVREATCAYADELKALGLVVRANHRQCDPDRARRRLGAIGLDGIVGGDGRHG